jgi:hypothetical protein
MSSRYRSAASSSDLSGTPACCGSTQDISDRYRSAEGAIMSPWDFVTVGFVAIVAYSICSRIQDRKPLQSTSGNLDEDCGSE